MSRSIWKGPFSLKDQKLPVLIYDQKFHKNVHRDSNFIEKTSLIWSRSSMILPKHIAKDVKIYNGKVWIYRKIVEEMVGHKFGEFCSTKKKTVHKLSKNKQGGQKK